MTSFKEIGLQEGIVAAVEELGFENLTPIQDKTIPHLLSSKQDVIAVAQTGTGKTAAFGLPALQLTDVEDRRTQTLVLCPTRELCMQIALDLTSYSKNMPGINIVAVYGGANIEPQIKDLARGAHIVVGTPGRTRDLIHRRKLLPGNVQRLVLDEADEMLTMGFKDELDAILDKTPSTKQTLLFSATMSKEVIAITKTYMRDPVEISVSQVNTGAENVRHLYYMVQAKDRYEVLKRIADINPAIYGIVFCRTRRETREVANRLMHDGYNADALHGDLSQAQRDEVMGRFRTGQLQLLVATDVAARGLDVNDLTHVINYNLPDDPEIYIHRSGRTGRAGKSGIAISIIHTRESMRIREIEKKFKVDFTKEPVPTGKDICTKQLYILIDKIEKVAVDEQQIEPFLPAIYQKLEWLSREELIKHFVSAEFNRFLTYYKDAKDINVPDRQREERQSKSGKRGREERGKVRFSRFYINAGSKNNLSPLRLIGLINNGLDSGDAQIGQIEIMKKFSFFEIDSSVESQILQALNGQKFDGITLSVEVSQERPVVDSTPRTKTKTKEGKRKNAGTGGGRRDRAKRK